MDILEGKTSCKERVDAGIDHARRPAHITMGAAAQLLKRCRDEIRDQSMTIAVQLFLGEYRPVIEARRPAVPNRRNFLRCVDIACASSTEEQHAVAAHPALGSVLQQADERRKTAPTCDTDHRRRALTQPEVAMRSIEIEAGGGWITLEEQIGKCPPGHMADEGADLGPALRQRRSGERIRSMRTASVPANVDVLPGAVAKRR